jgi:hypothetical protein
LRQNISVPFTAKKFAPKSHFINLPPPLLVKLTQTSYLLPSPFVEPEKLPPPQDPIVVEELVPHPRLVVSTPPPPIHLSQSPTYLSLRITLTTTTADETLTPATIDEQVHRRPSFLLEDDLVTCRPLSLYLTYISLPMHLLFFPNLTLSTYAGHNSQLGHNINGGNKGST